jgi:hypothetical protein
MYPDGSGCFVASWRLFSNLSKWLTPEVTASAPVFGTGALAAAGHGRGGRSGPQVFLLVDLRQFGADRNDYVNGRNSPQLLDLA